MKKLFLLLALLCGCALGANAQVKVFCKIIERPAVKKNKIAVDLGSEKGMFYATELKGKKDKAVKFETGVAAVNFMSQHGWQFVQAFVSVTGTVSTEEEDGLTTGSTSSEFHYLMCKDFETVEDAETELSTKFVRNKQFK